MKKKIIFIVITCIAIAVILPTLLKANSAKKNDLNTTINRNLNIELAENPTTGYSWHIVISHPEILKIVRDDYIQQGNLIGSGGIHKWEIKGTKEGSTTVKFELYRDWEPLNIIETKTYQIIVTTH